MIPNKVAPHMAGSTSRLEGIAHARQAMLMERNGNAPAWLAPWVERSWQRCIGYGLQPQQTATFQVLSQQEMRRTEEANAHLVRTAKPLLENLGHAIVNTRYFAILTNMRGVVVDVSGAIDRGDPRADLITRVGTDLSERSMGTTAISTALAELQPVWLHRGEHFFSNTTHYSCAGAPVTGPDGQCAGMLDLTGIEATERPELKHLVTQAASKIENALVLAQPHRLTLRLNWPGNSLGSDADGLVCLDGDGWITGANPIARQMVPQLATSSAQTVHRVHVSEVFGVAFEQLFDAARRSHPILEVPLWNGLRLQVMAIERDKEDAMSSLRMGSSRPESGPLKDIETALIRRAVDEARGNVAQAAQALGISRATVYRKLGKK
jgi:sigma-54 dependent transcriptional regulator, acetoin dehydrogenase operon transcriptional activator AcoR